MTELFTERTPRVVAAAKLHRSAGRRKAGRFLIEGENSVAAALGANAVRELFLTEEAQEKFSDLLARYPEQRHSLITDKAAQSLAETVTTVGLFAVCDSALASIADVIANADSAATAANADTAGDNAPAAQRLPLIAVPVNANDPGNAGTIIRLADAFGAAGVIFAGETVDPESNKVIRSSAGSFFNVPVARDRGISGVIEDLHEAGYTVVATTMDGDVQLGCADANELLAGPVAWMFGNEAHGLGEWLDLADVRISIPMFGAAESLNLGTAAAICLYESAKAHAANSGTAVVR